MTGEILLEPKILFDFWLELLEIVKDEPLNTKAGRVESEDQGIISLLCLGGESSSPAVQTAIAYL